LTTGNDFDGFKMFKEQIAINSWTWYT
jgi:hypothetical protein